MNDVDRLERCLLGIALGDSLGLPMEGIKALRSGKLFRGPLRQRMFLGKGLLSDDTIMAVATVQAYYRAPDDVDRFAAELARRLKKWFWTIPPGIGLATVRGCLRLSLGARPQKSGVRSAGNGPAIRAIVLGYLLAGDREKLQRYVEASTRITHTHPLAIQGSLLVASAATGGLGVTKDWPSGYPPSGPTGFMVHTVNAAFDCVRAYPASFEDAVSKAIELGGDTDSVAAIVGGLIGASEGDVPPGWLRWIGWPQSGELRAIADGSNTRLPVEKLIGQHLLTDTAILPHLIKRALPPY